MNDRAGAYHSAGAMLRAARERQGLHIASLAAAIKVTPRKLDALENDRYDDLPGPAFTRALAQTVCRSLKIEPGPVLALLPQADPAALDHVAGTLNQPFRDRPSRADPSWLLGAAIKPMVGAAIVLILAALAIHYLPDGFWNFAATQRPAVHPASAAIQPAASASVPASEPQAASMPAEAPAVAAAPSAAGAMAAAVAPSASVPTAAASVPQGPLQGPLQGLVQLRASGDSWVQAIGPKGQLLYSHLLQAGETAAFDGDTPIKLTIGNAKVTEVVFRGQPVDLAPSTRNSVARLELK